MPDGGPLPEIAVPGPAPAAPAPRSAAKATAARVARTRLLVEGRIGPTLARLAAPNVIAMGVQTAMSIAEGYFAGRMGLTALAGLALVFPLVMLTQMLSAGAMGGAISSAVARALGADDAPRAGALTLAAWAIAAAAAILSAFLVAVFGPAIFRLLGGDSDAVAAALTYAGVFFPGCITLWLCHSTLSVIRGTGNMLVPSLLLLLVSAGSIPLSGGLALGWGPLPALGMPGLAAGLVGAYGLGALAALAWVARGGAGLSLAGAPRRLRAAMFGDILRVGLVASLNAVQTVLTIVLMTGLVARHGAAALAGYGLGARLEFLMVPVIFGIGAAMTAMVGANIGAGRHDRALRTGWTGALAAAGIVGAIGVTVAIAPDLWLGMFLDTADPASEPALAAGRAYFRIVGPAYGFFAVGLALYFASQGAARMLWPVVASLCRMAVAIGGAITLTAVAGADVTGVFAAIAAGMATYGLVTAAAVALTRWR